MSQLSQVANVNQVSTKRSAGKSSLAPTHNDLPADVRQKVAALLQARLTQAVDLTMQCKQAHWTTKGPHFIALHQLFDDAHDEMRAAMDVLADFLHAQGDFVLLTSNVH